MRRSKTQRQPSKSALPKGTLDAIDMDADPRIVLRAEAGEVDDLIVEYPGQPADYTHADGTVWTWQHRWLIIRGVRLRLYDLAE